MAAHELLSWIHCVFANANRWALGLCQACGLISEN